jgi:hypothetical protein
MGETVLGAHDLSPSTLLETIETAKEAKLAGTIAKNNFRIVARYRVGTMQVLPYDI